MFHKKLLRGMSMYSGYVINGGKALYGRLKMQGAKNSVLPILAAAILGKGRVIVSNCPDLSDVAYAVSILRYLGCAVHWENGVVEVALTIEFSEQIGAQRELDMSAGNNQQNP